MTRIGETSYRQTAFGIIPRSKLILLEIEGTKKAWDFILAESAKGRIPLSVNFIKELHKTGFGWILPEFGGQFRTIDVTVSAHTPPPFYRVGPLMADLTADLETRLENLPALENNVFFDALAGLLAWWHHRLLWIHPFVDYNGRIARLLINAVLLNLNLPPIELKVETKKGRAQYVHALKAADQSHYQELEEIIRQAIEESAQAVAA